MTTTHDPVPVEAVSEDTKRLREALQGAEEAIDWLNHHLREHHYCLHTDAAISGIPAWLAKARAAIAASPSSAGCA